MPLVLIKEDGTGKPDANSYANIADADTYHEGHLYAASWAAATPETKSAALVMATRLIDSFFHFHGRRASDTQGLQWPRQDVFVSGAATSPLPTNAIPDALVQATAETARELIKVDRTAAPEGEGIARLVLFNNKSTTYDPADRPPVIPSVVQAMLSSFGRYVARTSGPVQLQRA